MIFYTAVGNRVEAKTPEWFVVRVGVARKKVLYEMEDHDFGRSRPYLVGMRKRQMYTPRCTGFYVLPLGKEKGDGMGGSDRGFSFLLKTVLGLRRGLVARCEERRDKRRSNCFILFQRAVLKSNTCYSFSDRECGNFTDSLGHGKRNKVMPFVHFKSLTFSL